MHRPALARLYRPKSFSEIVGQGHVSATLRTAVERERVAHAYLFCGPRGIGKTTAARVLAMALNCEYREEGEPCGRCESCQRIWAGRTSLDVVEIDAASNRGVDDARELRERAMYAPSEESRYKVYIIDEAHMLTREAWNAFLKILEEPPPRVIFVLATTEPGKIFQSAPPILSRCQRFDFHRISTEAIRTRLREVLEAEGVEAQEAALIAIARKADGALRDALSALDQVLAFSTDSLAVEDVREVLGLVEDELYLELLEIIRDGRAGDIFAFIDRLVAGGYDLEEFYRGLSETLRLLLRLRLEGADAGPAENLGGRYSQLAEEFTSGDLLRMLSGLAELDTDGRFRKSEQQRILIEVALLKFAMLDRTVRLEELIASVGGSPSRGGPGSSGGPQSAGGPKTGRTPPPDGPEGEGLSGGEAGNRSQGSTTPHAPASEAEPAPAPEEASESAEDPVGRARSAWREMIAGGRALRPGQGIALRAARLVELDGEGRLHVSVARDTPGAELLGDPVTRRRIEEELSQRLQRPIRLQEAGQAEALPPRVSPDAARRQRLERLIEGDKGLKRLVDRLDLELMD